MSGVTTLPDKSPYSDIDWEAVERDYRLGTMSLRELGKLHGCSYATIGQKAKQRGWTKDLSAAIKQKVRQRLASIGVNDANATDDEITTSVAEQIAGILGSHRSEIKRLRNTLTLLTDNLQELMLVKAKTPAVIKERGELARLITMTLKELVAMERESFDVANQNEAPPPEVDPNDVVELARRVAFTLRLGVEAMGDAA